VRLAIPPRCVIQFYLLAALILLSSFGSAVFALDAREYAIEASVEVLTAPFALRLSWRGSDKARSYTIYRRIYGSNDWGPPRAALGWNATDFTDTDVSAGVSYEYEIQMESTVPGTGGWVKAYGYVLAGGNVSWPDQKGKVVLIVDPTAASAAGSEIGGLMRDLLGAGWFPIRRDIGGGSSVNDVKNIIRAEYNADPSNVRSVFLIGHVPVPYSGNIAPDLHASHKGAWPADVFYADVDGNWSDSVVDIVSGDYRANDNRPGDGKFDQSEIPSPVELEIGRIDFVDLPTFGGRTAGDMLRTYLQKDHQFRFREFTAERRGLIRDNFGDLSGDAPAVDAWRHFPQFFGQGKIREVGPGDFFWTLNNESFLWAYGCGGGGLNKADGVGTTYDFATQSPRAVFMVLHGSYFGDWNTTDNFLRAAVAGNGYTLASIWSGLPHWYMHPMALGGSVGSVTRLTQNNVGQYKSHQNFSAGQVHISLIGDPTLEMFPVMPASNLSGSDAGAVNLSWNASGDQGIVGYHVYYSTSAGGPFQRLTSSSVSATSYSHQVGTGTHYYMVRAVKLERTGSGTFYHLSQGVFTTVNVTRINKAPTISPIPDQTIEASATSADIAFQVSDPETAAGDLQVRVASSNSQLIPQGGIVLGGSGANRIVRVTAASGVTGSVTVTVFVSDGVNEVGSAFNVTIIPANLPPTATSLTLETFEDAPVEITLSGTDPDGDVLAYEIVTQPSSGTLVGTNRTYTYTPQTNFFGADSFSFRVRDQKFASEPATVTLNIAPKNDVPVIGAVAPQTVRKNSAIGPVSIEVADVDRPISELLLFAQSSNPLLVGTNDIVFDLLGATRSMIVTPISNATGVAEITVFVSDGQLSNVTRFQITVTNTPPIAKADLISSDAGTMIIPVAQLLTNDVDADGDSLSVMAVSAHSQLGRSIVLTNETIIYDGTLSGGEDSFNYTVEDSSHASSSADVRLNLKPRPHIETITVASGEVTLSVLGEPERPFTVWGSEDAETWFDAGGGITDAAGRAVYKEIIGGDERHRFFKIEWY
jgi:hypothetical protein